MLRRPSPSSPAPGSQAGIALVLVLWVITLLSVMALSAVSTSRTEINLVRNRLDEARMRALAEAGVSMAVLRLRSTQEEDHWYPDGLPNIWQFAGQEVQIQVYNESSRVDLNKASEQVLVDLITAVGMEGVDADAIVASLLDWRDTDQSARRQGAEDRDYRGDGLPYGAKDNAFDSAAEFSQVLGVPKGLGQVLEPHLTVHSRNSRVMLEYASPLVSAALGGADQPQLPGRGGMAGQQGSGDAPESERRSLGGPVYRIRVSGSGPAVETLVRVGGGSSGIFNVISRRFDWREELDLNGEGGAGPGDALE